VLVLQVNPETSRIALSIKRLDSNPWDDLDQNHQAGDIVDAHVTSIMRFGIFARLEEGIEGLIHISSIPEELRVKDLKETFNLGQAIQVKILHIDAERRRLGLSLVAET
jgi:small subunit ribosomal protein S1